MTTSNGLPLAAWNPLTGCEKISPGCKNCYAERGALQLQKMGQQNYKNGFKLTLHENMLKLPLFWKEPQCIFVNGMSDLFHKDVPIDFIERIFEVMNEAHWHQFQILTKRSERLAELSGRLKWAENIWMGVTVESSEYQYRIDHLKSSHAKNKYLSFTPLLGEIQDLDLTGIDWVILGGETGMTARAMKPEWVTSIRDRCVEKKTPFFFINWGESKKDSPSNRLEGQAWEQVPAAFKSARPSKRPTVPIGGREFSDSV